MANSYLAMSPDLWDGGPNPRGKHPKMESGSGKARRGSFLRLEKLGEMCIPPGKMGRQNSKTCPIPHQDMTCYGLLRVETVRHLINAVS